jgi:EcsC protein family
VLYRCLWPWPEATLAGVQQTAPIEEIAGPPKRVWDRILAEPDRAPEIIALVAAERFGPQAAQWVRIMGPGHAPADLARTAFKKHVRLARLEGGALGIGGAITAAPDVVALLWLQSRMVFYIAAAYGYDPNHAMRPAEYLALQGLYDTPAQAREALDGVGKRLAFAIAEKSVTGRHAERLHARVAKYIARRLVRRYAGRLIPFVGAPLGAIQNGGVTKDLGRRALAYYGGEARRPDR